MKKNLLIPEVLFAVSILSEVWFLFLDNNSKKHRAIVPTSAAYHHYFIVNPKRKG